MPAPAPTSNASPQRRPRERPLPVAGEAARAAILAAVTKIPTGRVTSYGQVAWLAGLPGRARLVGRVLGTEIDATIPWHRVINARGEIALPKFSPSHREQKRRLRAEGIAFENGRVSLRRFGWQAGGESPLLD